MALSPTSSRGSSGGVATVAAGDASIVVGGTGTNPTLETGTLDAIATLHPSVGAWGNNGNQLTNVAAGTAPSDVAVVSQLPAKGSSSAALGLSAYSMSPNAPLGSANPGGGELVRLILLDTMPAGTITGAAIGLESLGISPSGTAQLGLATFSSTATATYVAVTANIATALTSGATGIRRFDFTAPYTADGSTPLWVAIAFTAAWGTDITIAATSIEAALGGANAGHYQPRYANIAAGAGTLTLNGTHSAWSSTTGFTFFAGVY